MSREPIRWTDEGRAIGQGLLAFGVIWALLALVAGIGGSL